MFRTIKITLAVAVAALLLSTGVAAASQSHAAMDAAQHPAKMHEGPAHANAQTGKPSASNSGRSERASSYATVSGYITSSGGLKTAGAVAVQYWNSNSQSWVNYSSKYTSSNGYYSVAMPAGWYWRISAAAVSSQCRGGMNGSEVTLKGVSDYFTVRNGSSYGLNVSMPNQTFRYC